MKACIITIGDEILLGQILDTNSRFIARELAAAGAETVEMRSVSDGRDEILHAARECVDAGEALTEENFAKHLYSAGVPDPELIIRPSGEIRLSNFLLWQCAYSELYFCDTLWPDFDERTLDAAIIDYQKRDRRFGGVK